MFALAALMVLMIGAPLTYGASAVRNTVQPARLDALFKAAIEGDVARVRTLLNQGADVNARNRTGVTLLMSAVSIESRYEEGKIDHGKVVGLLLSRGADVNATDRVVQTALMKALTGHASEWKVIGATTQIVRLLLAHGAKVNAMDQEGGRRPHPANQLGDSS
jgi:ankyrin repeat protein